MKRFMLLQIYLCSCNKIEVNKDMLNYSMFERHHILGRTIALIITFAQENINIPL